MTNFRPNFNGSYWNNNSGSGHELPYTTENQLNVVRNISVYQNSFHQQFNSSKNNFSNIPPNVTVPMTQNIAVMNPFEVHNTSTTNATFIPSSNHSKSLVNNTPYPIADNKYQTLTVNLSHNVQNVPGSSQNAFLTSKSTYQSLDFLNGNVSMSVMSKSPFSTATCGQSVDNKVLSACTLNESNWHNFPSSTPQQVSQTMPMHPKPPVLPSNSNLATCPAKSSVKFNVNNIRNPFNMGSIPHQNLLLPDSLSGRMPAIQSNIYAFPPPVISPLRFSTGILPSTTTFHSEKDRLLSNFLSKFKSKGKKSQKSNLTIVEYRAAIKTGLSLYEMLSERKISLTKCLNSAEDEWNLQAKEILQIQIKLTEICDLVSNPSNLSYVQKKLLSVKKKREEKKRRKLILLSSKQEAEQKRRELNEKIDKCLDNIKEKNLDHKRKMEMKKEADCILSEVRRKIQEAKRTIEKLKTFEKLRNARHINAMKKSLIIQPEHTENFEKRIIVLKEVMLKQLSDYEAEERALKVILEAEQEGQLEEEALWRAKKIKTILQRRQKNFTECLFGKTDEPNPTDQIFLFYSHHNSANSCISSLGQIRHHWDMFLSNDGESVPQQWVTPVPPSSVLWEQFCSS